MLQSERDGLPFMRVNQAIASRSVCGSDWLSCTILTSFADAVMPQSYNDCGQALPSIRSHGIERRPACKQGFGDFALDRAVGNPQRDCDLVIGAIM